MEKIDKRIEELEDKLSKTVLGSKEARDILDELDRLYQMRLREEKAQDERYDRNRQFDLQEMRYEAERREAASESKRQRWNRVWDGVKYIGGVAGTLGAVVLIAAVEEKTIVGQKLLNVAMKVLPKIV